jgi:hypothetical protein
MLNGAKHLLFLVEQKQEQIPSLRSGHALRFAQDDRAGAFSAACWGLVSLRTKPQTQTPGLRYPGHPGIEKEAT